MANKQFRIAAHLEELKECTLCPEMVGPVVVPRPVLSKVYLVGQAPGPREGDLGRPFAWTAGKALFKWFARIGVDEETFRSRAYLSAVGRCFPGKTKQGGDRVPDKQEIENCAVWMEREVALLKPELVIPIGRLAIEQFLPKAPLAEIVGKKYRREVFGVTCDLVPLPHPSGASTWTKREPGLGLLEKALRLLKRQPAWKALRDK